MVAVSRVEAAPLAGQTPLLSPYMIRQVAQQTLLSASTLLFLLTPLSRRKLAFRAQPVPWDRRISGRGGRVA